MSNCGMLINNNIGVYSKDKSVWIAKEGLVEKVIFAALNLSFERVIELRQIDGKAFWARKTKWLMMTCMHEWTEHVFESEKGRRASYSVMVINICG